MSQGTTRSRRASRAKSIDVGHELKQAAVEEHKAAKTARQVDSAIYAAGVVASGNPKRIERYFLRKLLYKLFGKFMGKTINRI